MATTRDKIYKAPPVELVVLDVPPLFPGNEQVPGVYLAARTGGKVDGRGLNATGKGARSAFDQPLAVYLSRDGGTTFAEVATLTKHATTGTLLATTENRLGDDTGGYGAFLKTTQGAPLAIGWDSVSKMPIQWDSGYVPASTTTEEVLNGANRLLVGNEVIAYKTVAATAYASGFGSTDATADGIYWHSDLLRGRRGTENEIANRTFGELVVAVDQDSVVFFPLAAGDLWKSLVFRAGAPGMDMSLAEQVTITPVGRNVLPFPPASVTGVRDGSNDLTISFARRTRSIVRTTGVKAYPYGEDAERYKVEILSTPMPYTVLRTIETTSGSAAYTAAQHTTDGLTAGGAINFRVYQWSDVAGWGNYSTWTMPANAGGAGTPTPSATLLPTRLD